MPTSVTNSSLTVAVIDPIFQQQLDKLKGQAKNIYKSSLSIAGNQRQWQIPVPITWDLNLFNISGIKGAYDRTKPNAIYLRALLKSAPIPGDGQAPKGEGRIADCQVEKIQVDYLAAQERAFRLRHASSIRCKIHAAARRRGHSTDNDQPDEVNIGGGLKAGPDDVIGPVGGVFTNMIRYLYILLKGGYNEGAIDIEHGPTTVIVLADGTVKGAEGEIV